MLVGGFYNLLQKYLFCGAKSQKIMQLFTMALSSKLNRMIMFMIDQQLFSFHTSFKTEFS